MYNAAIDMLIRDVFSFDVATKLIRQVWNNTPEASNLRRLYTDVIVRQGDVGKLLDPEGGTKDDFCEAAMRDIALACWAQYKTAMLGGRYDFWLHRCVYHIHAVGEFCLRNGAVQYDHTYQTHEPDDFYRCAVDDDASD